MHLLLHFLLTLTAAYAEIPAIQLTQETAVYAEPDTDAEVLYYLKAGDVIHPVPVEEGFMRLKVRRAGRVVVGFIVKPVDAGPTHAVHTWGFGLGASYMDLSQKGKSFQTDDQVQYQTTDYVSTAVFPFLTGQWGDSSFWRLSVGTFSTHFTATATTNVLGSSSQSVSLKQNYIAAVLQKAWSPWNPHFYFGAGAELAKATSVGLTLGGQPLGTTSADEPVYLGAQGFVGAHTALTDSVSLFGEARLTVIANQSPIIMSYEGLLGLLYWP